MRYFLYKDGDKPYTIFETNDEKTRERIVWKSPKARYEEETFPGEWDDYDDEFEDELELDGFDEEALFTEFL